MGLTYLDLHMLWKKHQAEGRFDRIVAIGRQRLYLHPNELARLQGEFGSAVSDALRGYRRGDYFEPYLAKSFGSQRVVSIDNSDFQGAEIIHDMNQTIPPEFVGQFDLAIDGGTLEHIFNFPTAISNMMNLVVEGGYVLMSNPANNLCGHGFYQFSPELVYRVFSDANGFSIQEVVLAEHRFPRVEMRPHGRAVRVRDPETVGERILALSCTPLMMHTIAQKIKKVPAFSVPPQQSDYTAAWEKSNRQPTGEEVQGALRGAFTHLPEPLRLLASGYRQRARYRLSNRRFFEPYA